MESPTNTEHTGTAEEPLSEMPEDVAILYSWANIQGAKYRDFSASRREYRAQVRHRAAENLRASELRAKVDAESAARSTAQPDGGADRERALREAEDATRRAAAERVEAARRTELAAMAEAVALREEREIADTHASAQRQAASYTQLEARTRVPTGPVLGKAGDPYETVDRAASDPEMTAVTRKPDYPAHIEHDDEYTLQQELEERSAYRPEPEVQWRSQEYHPNDLPDIREASRAPNAAVQQPVLAVFSLTGGVGKTSMVATLGRALSSMGEKVLLTDTTSQGLLPYYFGAGEQRPSVAWTFSPPGGSSEAPIYLVSYKVDKRSSDAGAQEQLVEDLARSASGTSRILLDLDGNSGWLVRRLGRINPTVLAPMSPDMNSVIGLESAERFFEGAVDADGRSIQPYYLLNQFDASLPLHLDVREVLRRRLGDRLLPFVVRRAAAVSEALAEGMTVIDYAPEAAIAADYMNVAEWIRNLSATATQDFHNAGWSER